MEFIAVGGSFKKKQLPQSLKRILKDLAV